MSRQNYSVARVKTRTQDSVGKFERHIERKNEHYANMSVDLERAPINIQYRTCGDMTYNEMLQKLVNEGKVSMRGLKKDAKVYDELIFDINSEYFEEHGGYEFAKAFYEEAYYSVTNNYKREQAYFFCSSFRKNSDECSAHYIREKVVMENVLESMRRILLNVQAFEKEFARKQMECYSEDKKRELAEKRRELNKAKKRIAEIDGLIQKIYEDNAIGKISDERYATLSMSYEEEQRDLKTALPDMETYLEAETDKTESLQRFIQKVKRITELKELTAELVHEFIDRIVVHAPRYLDGKRVQLIDIYYNGVGILRELTPEEMEEAFQNHMAERKAKTA